jgi:hypothetical protein
MLSVRLAARYSEQINELSVITTKNHATTITNPSGVAQQGKRSKMARVLNTPHGDSRRERV